MLNPAGMNGAIVDQASARKRNLPPGHQLLWGIPTALADGVDDHGAAPGYSAMLFLLPERNTALVLEQNLYGLLHDEAVMQVGLGAVRILAAGRPRPQSPRPATTRPSGASRPWP